MQGLNSLMGAAREATGLVDFGDESFLEGLRVLVAALAREARLNAIGQAVMKAVIVDLLGSRLKIEHWYARHPRSTRRRSSRP